MSNSAEMGCFMVSNVLLRGADVLFMGVSQVRKAKKRPLYLFSNKTERIEFKQCEGS
jgi:hypothetical protein